MKKKVKNSFNAYQLNRVNARIKLIENYLLESHNINREFINITDLAIKLSHFITKNEKQACDKSTLLRNKIYKSYINDYFYSQNNTKNTVTGNTLKIKQLKEEISLLEQENNLLKNNNPLGKSLILIKQKNPLDTTNKILITIYLPEELDTKLSKKMKINNMDRQEIISYYLGLFAKCG